MKIATVFLNGSEKFEDFEHLGINVSESDIFCADGGANLARKNNLCPKLILGDMDSISSHTREFFADKCKFELFPKNKDKSDGELILERVYNLNYSEIFIFNATGGRLDQTFLNLTFLEYYPNARIITEKETVFPISQELVIKNKIGCGFSLVAVSKEIELISLSGFKFCANSVKISRGSSLTSSNKITDKIASIRMKSGFALAFVTHS